MQRFQLIAQVRHRVTDVVTLVVDADSEEEAFAKAKKALSFYPRPVEEDDIPYCYIEHRVYGDTEVENIENMEKEDSA